jgi:iron complex transport system substrate-binding protein
MQWQESRSAIERLAACAVLAALCSGAGRGQPSRIVSTAPGITEILFAIGAGGRVVGVSSHCDYPEAARRLPKIGTYSRPDPEKIAALRPDLVILHENLRDAADRLSAMRIPLLLVEMHSITGVLDAMVRIGAASGCEQQALRIVKTIRDRLEAAGRAAPPRRPRALIIVGRHPGGLTGLIAAGPGSWLHELAETAGVENVLKQDKVRYPRVSLETVITLDPDLILDASGTMASGTDRNGHRMRALQPWREHPELKAVRTQRVVILDDELFVRPGPRIPEALERIAAVAAGGSR